VTLSNPSPLERSFATRWRQLGNGVELEREYRFAAHHVGLGPGIRKRLCEAGLKDWRLDFAHVPSRVAVELHGATYARGRHTRGAGFRDDREKMNAAQMLGWIVIEITSDMLSSDPAGYIEQIVTAIEPRAEVAV